MPKNKVQKPKVIIEEKDIASVEVTKNVLPQPKIVPGTRIPVPTKNLKSCPECKGIGKLPHKDCDDPAHCRNATVCKNCRGTGRIQ